jgi:hypothetical protein
MSHILTSSLLRNLAVAAAIGILWMFTKKPCRTSALSGAAYIDELLHGHERRAFEVFRMPITVFEDLCTLAAERQVRDFLIGPRNKKTRKKRSNIKILHPPVQITSQGF